MSYCRNCRDLLTAKTRSSDTFAYCATCGDLVDAFRPNRFRPDEWFAIPTLEDGATAYGNPCDVCWLSVFTLRRCSATRWAAVCEGQDWDGERIAGCQTEHPVRQRTAMSVIF